MTWRRIVGWTSVVWGTAVIILAVAGVLFEERRVLAVLAGLGLVVPGINFITQARTMQRSEPRA